MKDEPNVLELRFWSCMKADESFSPDREEDVMNAKQLFKFSFLSMEFVRNILGISGGITEMGITIKKMSFCAFFKAPTVLLNKSSARNFENLKLSKHNQKLTISEINWLFNVESLSRGCEVRFNLVLCQ
ncbi:hypothetical protein BpHYR1_030815 [Brachionus plicatilis]|uniref:Uncharacterized protein n=1 Tax=Brachionus plicatilis TaxID=10195 RepID=A0A3M7PAH0_BRAPC|nr:hypothetical protein BpHYR1_030815 [Brachionus plicatilis]